MDGVRWDRIEELFEQALARPAGDRAVFLARACEGDPRLRVELEAMLAAAGDDHALGVERLVVDDRPADDGYDPLVGTCLGAWRVTEVLGRGGMGLVYRGERADGAYRQDVAIKLVRALGPELHAIERFRTERQVLAHLVHPNIAALLDGGFAPGGTPYLVMELVDGVPITDWCVGGRLPLDARLRLFRVVCDAVQHAHRSLIVHRDLKPSNILVSRSGDVKLLDFGIAKLLNPGALDVGAPATHADVRLLTPEYAAPEQRHDGPITTATDVYALGVLLYELLTGARPRSGLTAPSDALRRSPSAPNAPDARRLARRVRGDLDRIVLTALREEPDRRYASAGQLSDDIGRFLGGRAVLAQPDTLTYRVRKFVGRNRVAVAAGGLLVSSITVFAAMSALQARALAEQSRAARLERDKAEQVVGVLVKLFEAANPTVRPRGDRMPIGEFLAGAQAAALEQLRPAPGVRAKLQQVFGQIHYERGEYTRAREALEEALAEQRRLGGPNHPDALESLQALGTVLLETGQESRARPLVEESVERHRQVYGEDHEKFARALFGLAPIVARTDRARAGAMLAQVLAIRRRVLPANHPDLAMVLGALAEFHRQLGERDRARELYLEALAAFENPRYALHPRLVTLMSDYASLLEGMSAHREAEAVQRRAIALGEQVLGRATLPVANLLNNLAVSLTSQGRFADAERVFREAFDLHRGLFGENHARVRNLARNIGVSIAMQDRPGEALGWLDRAVAIRTDVSASGDPALSGIRAQRALVVSRLGRREEALAEIRRAVSVLQGMKDSAAPYWLAFSRVGLGRILLEMGRPRDAVTPLGDALRWLERFGPEGNKRAEAECALGWAEVLQGRRAEGVARLERWLPVYRAWGQADRRLLDAAAAVVSPSR